MNRNLTILIAEDSEDDAFFLRRAMERIGWKNPVQILTDGGEVMDYLKGEGRHADRSRFPFPSVMFIDIKMPRVNGFEVLQWLKEHEQCKVVPTIIFTASDHPKDIERAYRLGANAYFVKPATANELQNMLRCAYDFWLLCAKPAVPTKCA